MDNTTQRVPHDTVKLERALVSPGSAAGGAMRPSYAQAYYLDSKDDWNG
jgi:hypothetical protein